MKRILFLLLVGLLSPIANGGELDRAREITKQLSNYEAKLTSAEQIGPGPFADAKFSIFRLQYVLSTSLRDDGKTLGIILAEADRAMSRLVAPKAAQTETGVLSRAYISEIDRSVQPYILYVPTTYDAGRPWPLLVYLHGYDPMLIAPGWGAEMCPMVLSELCEREGLVLLMPYGRGNTDFMGIGEKDVLDTISFAQREFSIDPERINLAGLSMGGSGAYTISCHYPDRFASLTIFTGRADYYQWMNVSKGALPRFKQIYIDTDYAIDMLSNLQHVPVLIYHGTDDLAIPTAQSRQVYEKLTSLGQRATYHEMPEADHYSFSNFIEHPDFAEMLRTARRKSRPNQLRFKTMSTKYSSAYWFRIDEIDQWGSHAAIVAEAAGNNVIDIKADNVAAFSIGPELPEDIDPASVRLILNGAPAEFTRKEGLLRFRSKPPADSLVKGPELCGPIREAYDGPFVIVYPGGDDAKSRRAAQDANRLAREWVLYAQGMPQLMVDSAVNDAVVRDANLVLCGGPGVNRYLDKISDQFPFRIEKERFIIGSKVVHLEEGGLQVIYPNPLNPERYVHIIIGVPWGGSLPQNHKLDFLPDFIAYSADPEPDGTQFPTNKWICAGYFDSRWQVSESTIWYNQNRLHPSALPNRLENVVP